MLCLSPWRHTSSKPFRSSLISVPQRDGPAGAFNKVFTSLIKALERQYPPPRPQAWSFMQVIVSERKCAEMVLTGFRRWVHDDGTVYCKHHVEVANVSVFRVVLNLDNSKFLYPLTQFIYPSYTVIFTNVLLSIFSVSKIKLLQCVIVYYFHSLTV